MKTTLKTVIATLALLTAFTGVLTACGDASDESDCQSNTTYLAQGTRRVLDVNLGFTPGPILVISTDQSAEPLVGGDQPSELANQAVSRPRRVWLDRAGGSLVALDQGTVYRVALASFEPRAEATVGQEAGMLAVTPDAGAMVVTDRIKGQLSLLRMDSDSAPVQIPVGAGPNAVAFGPGKRLAYVANEISGSLTIVETGLGAPRQDDRQVLVSATGQETLVALDGDGRVRRRYEGLPTRLRDMLLLPDGHRLVASYTELLITGDIGTLGDGDLAVDEGVMELDLETGAVTRWSLRAEAPGDDVLGRPCGLALVSGGNEVAVAVPGWSKIFVLDLGDASAGRGQVVRQINSDGAPSWLAGGDDLGDWLYALDERAHAVTALDSKGQVAGVASLR